MAYTKLPATDGATVYDAARDQYIQDGIVAAEGSSAQRASNLSDLASASTARTNLGLGSAATMTPATIAADTALTSTYVPWSAADEGVARGMGWVVATDSRWAGGADPTGATDSLAALNAAYAAGRTVFYPPGIYAVSGQVTVPDYSRSVSGARPAVYPNYTTDWQTASPSWGTHLVTIQRTTGTHGPIFSGTTGSTFQGLILRSGQVRTSADVAYGGAVNHCSISECVFQNLHTIYYNNGAAFGGISFFNNQVTGCQTAFGGVFLDNKVIGNTFTSMAGVAIDLSTGAGLNLVVGNRFEWGAAEAISLYTGARNNVINGNIFDAHAYYAVAFVQTSDPNVVAGNIFWRNGRAESNDYRASHIYIQASTGQTISANTFSHGGPDGGGGWTGPKHVLGIDSCSGYVNSFISNNTRSGCITSTVFVDRYDNSGRCLVLADLELPAGAAPGTGTDDIGAAIQAISTLSVAEVRVGVFQARQVNTYVTAPRVQLVGRASTTPVITNASGQLSIAGADNIQYGTLVYTARNGVIYTSAQPDEWGSNGNLPVGTYIYNAAPTAGGTQGWVKVATGSPDTWKTFGSVSA